MPHPLEYLDEIAEDSEIDDGDIDSDEELKEVHQTFRHHRRRGPSPLLRGANIIDLTGSDDENDLTANFSVSVGDMPKPMQGNHRRLSSSAAVPGAASDRAWDPLEGRSDKTPISMPKHSSIPTPVIDPNSSTISHFAPGTINNIFVIGDPTAQTIAAAQTLTGGMTGVFQNTPINATADAARLSSITAAQQQYVPHHYREPHPYHFVPVSSTSATPWSIANAQNSGAGAAGLYSQLPLSRFSAPRLGQLPGSPFASQGYHDDHVPQHTIASMSVGDPHGAHSFPAVLPHPVPVISHLGPSNATHGRYGQHFAVSNNASEAIDGHAYGHVPQQAQWLQQPLSAYLQNPASSVPTARMTAFGSLPYAQATSFGQPVAVPLCGYSFAVGDAWQSRRGSSATPGIRDTARVPIAPQLGYALHLQDPAHPSNHLAQSGPAYPWPATEETPPRFQLLPPAESQTQPSPVRGHKP